MDSWKMTKNFIRNGKQHVTPGYLTFPSHTLSTTQPQRCPRRVTVFVLLLCLSHSGGHAHLAGMPSIKNLEPRENGALEEPFIASCLIVKAVGVWSRSRWINRTIKNTSTCLSSDSHGFRKVAIA